MFVSLDFVHFFFFPLAAKLIGLRTGCQFFKKMLIFPAPTPLIDLGIEMTVDYHYLVKIHPAPLTYIYIYIPYWPFSPVWGVADNTKKTTKQWGLHSVLLGMTRDPAEFGWHCWSDTGHPPQLTLLHVPPPLLFLPQGCLYKATPWQQ